MRKSLPETPLLAIASFRQRVAAILLDGLILATLATSAWAAVVLSGRVSATLWLDSGMRRTIFSREPLVLGLAALAAYGMVFEWAAGATPGKMLCRMQVKSLGKRRCDFVGALVRTVLRPIDVAAGPILMLVCVGGQRLGDRVGNTTVVVTLGRVDNNFARKWVFATWEERMRAAIVDFALLAALGAGLFYLFGPGDNLTVVLVEVALWYFVLTTGWRGATVGKSMSGLRVEPLDGSPSFAVATLRAFVYPLNFVSCGIIPFLMIRFSSKRQNLADWAAASVVARSDGDGEGVEQGEEREQVQNAHESPAR